MYSNQYEILRFANCREVSSENGLAMWQSNKRRLKSSRSTRIVPPFPLLFVCFAPGPQVKTSKADGASGRQQQTTKNYLKVRLKSEKLCVRNFNYWFFEWKHSEYIMAYPESKEVDLRALWDKMLTTELVENLKPAAKSNISAHTLRAKMLLKVTFAELKGIIIAKTTPDFRNFYILHFDVFICRSNFRSKQC